MENSKLIQLLCAFDPPMLRGFQEFVASPFFNKDQELVRLYDYLKQLLSKGLPKAKTARQAVFAGLYPEKPYDEMQLNRLMSRLLQLAERFVSIWRYEQRGVLPDCIALEFYVETHLDKIYAFAIEKVKSKLDRLPLRNGDWYFQQFLLSDIAERHFSAQNLRRYDHHLQEASDHLDTWFLSQKLFYLCAMLDRQKILSTPYRQTFLGAMRQHLEQHNYENVPAVAVYHHLLNALSGTDDSPHFQSLKTWVYDSDQHFSKAEVKDLFYFAINFCINKLKHGDRAFAEDLVELYDRGLQKGVLLEDGLISPWTYKNMVKLGLGLRRFEWVERFITEYSFKLPADQREDAYHFNLADLFYHKKDYRSALFHLNQVEFTDIHYSLDAKTMLIKIYFETSETEAFLSLLSSFNIYLRRNKLISKEIKSAYLNFTAILQQINNLSKERRNALADKIKKAPLLTDRNWLLEQVD
ncbi:MAG: hypothetical protein HUU01_03805 [Saprospiraceae bacterium]|nr:hypothetical protein [Saprospiraceae bacterium]